jgi:hypothetical protein
MSSNFHLLLGNSNKDLKNVAGELALVFHTVKHISCRNTDYPNKLSKGIFHATDLAKKMTCSRTKAEAVKNAVFWDVVSCGSCKNRRFGGTYRLHHQGEKDQQARNNVNSN